MQQRDARGRATGVIDRRPVHSWGGRWAMPRPGSGGGASEEELATKVDRAGDTMTGPLVLPGPPVAENEAATKAYVDAEIAEVVGGGGGQPADATLTALAALDATPGLVEQTGADLFTKRPLGVAFGTSVPTLADNDARYAALVHTHAIADVPGLDTALAGKQPLDPTLTAFAALSGAADQIAYWTGADAFALTALTPFARTLIDDLTNTAARSTLGLGTAAVQNTGTSGATVPLLNAANTWSATQTFNGGDIVYGTTDFRVEANTADGADTKRIIICGGASSSIGRGGYIVISGNEHATDLGKVVINSGTGINLNGQSTLTSAIVGAPAGGNKGTGTLNAVTLYENDLALSAKYAPLAHTHTIADVTGLGTSATYNIGTSGPTVPLLNGASNTWTVGPHTFSGAANATGTLAVYSGLGGATDYVFAVYRDTPLDDTRRVFGIKRTATDPVTIQGNVVWHAGNLPVTAYAKTFLDDADAAAARTTLGAAAAADLASYAPLAHTHTTADVTGLDTALAAKADDSDLASYLPLAGGDLTGAAFLTSASDTAAIDPQIRLRRHSPTPAANDSLGGLGFYANDAGLTEINAAFISAVLTSATAGAAATYLRFTYSLAGAATEGARIGAGMTIGAPTGSLKGAGTLNVQNGIYENNVALSAKYEALGLLAGVNTQTASYTLVLTDAGKVVEINNASANTLTVPPNSSVAFAVGTRIDIEQHGAGQTTVTPGAGVTIRQRETKLKLAGQYAGASLYKRATDEWLLFGDLTA